MPEGFFPEARRVFGGRFYGMLYSQTRVLQYQDLNFLLMVMIVIDVTLCFYWCRVSKRTSLLCFWGNAHSLSTCTQVIMFYNPFLSCTHNVCAHMTIFTVWNAKNGVYLPSMRCKNWRFEAQTSWRQQGSKNVIMSMHSSFLDYGYRVWDCASFVKLDKAKFCLEHLGQILWKFALNQKNKLFEP